jgi:hypoxia up-regulated 1
MRDVVITVPPYADFKYRLALKDAVSLTGMNALSFIHENTAAALYLGINRLDNETSRIIFYNMGSSSLKVSLVEYKAILNEGKNKKTYP